MRLREVQLAMAKEWEEQLRTALNERQAVQARIRDVQQDLWQAEEARIDQSHRDIIDEFLENIHARNMLEIVKREMFGLSGKINSVFDTVSLFEEVGIKNVFYTYRVSDGEPLYHDDTLCDYVPYFLSGLELYRLIPKTPHSFKEVVSLIFIGFMGKSNVEGQLIESQYPAKYNYSKFGVTYFHRQFDIHYIDCVALARMAVTSEFKRKDHQYLIEMRDIGESELQKLLQSHSFQQQAQIIVQAGILDLVRSDIFIEKG